MKVKELIAELKKHDQDAEILIAEGFGSSKLVVMDDPANPDEGSEISL